MILYSTIVHRLINTLFLVWGLFLSRVQLSFTTTAWCVYHYWVW